MSRSKVVSDLIRKSGNPYWGAELDLQEAESQQSLAAAAHAEFKARQNPHAFDHYFGEAAAVAADVAHAIPAKADGTGSGISQAAFERRTRTIFAGYLPASGTKRLRPHHLAFITRNKSRSARVRGALIRQLEKYDVRTSGHFSTQFNREREVFTEAKLAEIERAVEALD